MNEIPDIASWDEDQVRAFYASCGMSESTIEAAIKVRRAKPGQPEKVLKPPATSKGKPKPKR